MPIKLLFSRKPDYDYDKSRTCVSCENVFRGRFCNICGEKIIEPHERTLKEFFHDVWSAFALVDGKLLLSLRTIILWPGKMSLDISQGKRIRYMKPIALFLVANVIYFLFPLFDTFNTKLNTQMHFSAYSKILSNERRAIDKAESLEVTMEEFDTIYNNKSATVSKTILITIIPIFSIFIAAIFSFTKRKFFDHSLFALEFFTFSLFYNIIGISLITYVLIKYTTLFSVFNLFDDNILTSLIIFLSGYFLVSATKRFYGLKLTKAILLVIPLLITMIVSVEIYRLLLFEVTMLSL